MSNPNEYAEYTQEDAPKNEALARLTALVAEAKQKEEQLEEIATSLKTAQESLRTIISVQIPSLMRDLGLDEVKLASGLKVEIKEDVQAGIPEARRAEAHKWLEDNNHGGMIKRDITVSFNKDQQEMAAKLMTELSAIYGAVTQKQAVHPSTLKAFVKEELEAGRPIPMDTFGVFRQKVAKFTETGKKRK